MKLFSAERYRCFINSTVLSTSYWMNNWNTFGLARFWYRKYHFQNWFGKLTVCIILTVVLINLYVLQVHIFTQALNFYLAKDLSFTLRGIKNWAVSILWFDWNIVVLLSRHFKHVCFSYHFKLFSWVSVQKHILYWEKRCINELLLIHNVLIVYSFMYVRWRMHL